VGPKFPWDDPSVERLSPGVRKRLGSYWEQRAYSELRVSRAFEAILRLFEQGAPASRVVVALLRKSIDDEVRHAELCRLLAERYGGSRVVPPAVPRSHFELPQFDGAEPPLRAALTIAALSCINETIASVWLRACFARARAPLARAANRFHLAEEIDHARLGWAHLASRHVTPAMRSAIALRLPRLLRANVPQWFREIVALPAVGVPDHGVLSRRTTRRVVLDAVDDVVLPGFAKVGIDVAPAVIALRVIRSWTWERELPADHGR
jgi:hypothetical protein